MTKTIVAKPNQSMLDIVIQAFGSMESAMAFCALNDVSISEKPVVGTVYKLPEITQLQDTLDESALKHFSQNGITLGTLGSPPYADLGLTIILKPVMFPTYAGGYPPDVLGYYPISLNHTIDFINVFPLKDTYPGDNMVYYEEAPSIVAGDPPLSSPEVSGVVMSAQHLSYHIPWTSPQNIWVWNPHTTLKTATFEDLEGNRASVSPVIVMLDHIPMFNEYMIANLDIEFVSTDGHMATLRLTRSHPPAVHLTNINPPYGHKNMYWPSTLPSILYEDPDNPGNPDIQLIDLPAGKYKFSVETEYVDDVNHFTWPARSVCTQVIEIA